MVDGWLIGERSVPPEETVARLIPHFGRLGITRLSRQTNLDRVGIPCWACFRPNAASLSMTQGKGLTDAAARASAVMEALEYAVAEAPSIPVIQATAEELLQSGAEIFLPDRLLPETRPLAGDAVIRWARGYRLGSYAPIWMPLDLINLDAAQTDLPGICKSTNGLASGNVVGEAILHGLCELVERDATTLWSLGPDHVQLGRAISPAAFECTELAGIIGSVESVGLSASLFDITSDISIPTIAAVVGPQTLSPGEPFAVCAGYACHPLPSVAAARALLEAVQSRVTAIAAARDDIDSRRFEESSSAWDLALLHAPARISTPVRGAAGIAAAEWQHWCVDILARSGVHPVAVELGGEEFGASVVKVVAHELEDRDANLNWRPGRRAFEALRTS